MSLATDILKRAEEIANPPPKARRAPRPSEPREFPKTKPPAPRTFARTKPPVKVKHKPTSLQIRNVYYHERSGGYEVRVYDGVKLINLGVFGTPSRASIAARIYKYWKRKGMTDIPNKPSIRLYTRR